MKVTIESHWAAEGDPASWSGEVPFSEVAPTEDVLEDIFALFNRVTERDVERLERMGYNLPSLSVNDMVTIHYSSGDEVYRVASAGFEQVS